MSASSKITTIIILFFTPISSIFAQEGWELGGFAGFSSYYGDLNPKYSFRRLGPSLGFMARKNFDGRICFKVAASFANVGASDKKANGDFERARNLSFSSNIFEASAVMEFNFQDFHSNRREDKPVAPFLMAGLGFLHFNPTTVYNGQRYNLRDMGTEGQARGEEYGLVTGAVILGGGVKIDMNENLSWNVEISGRLAFSDYLDDVKGVYGDPNAIAGYHGDVAAALADRSVEIGERIGRVGRQRGDSKANDSYVFMTVGLAYRFIPIGCPSY
jgi:hypothetical protein